MKRSPTAAIAALTILMVISSMSAAPQTSASVRYDGFYVAPSRGCTDYFRFYPNGTLAHACAMATPQQAARWLRKGYSPFGDAWGTYRLVGDQIIARVSAHRGEPGHTGVLWLEYRGQIRGERMVLRVQYRKTNYDETLRYNFMKIRLPPDGPNPYVGRSEPRPAPMRSFPIISSFSLQPRASSGAVTDLVSR